MEDAFELRELKPPLRSNVPVVFCIARNEMFFLPAFLEHYRALGFEQFVFLDDRSDDGSKEYILAQPDCAVITSSRTYGEYVDGVKVDMLWRNALPRRYSSGGWSLLVDADEFIELPATFATIQPFVAELDRRGYAAVGAVMVDFYPESWKQLLDATKPTSKTELFSRYPYFDDCYHGSWKPNVNRFDTAYGGVRDRLFRRYGITKAKERNVVVRIKQTLSEWAGRRKFNAIYKVPLVRWQDDMKYLTSHRLNRAPAAHLQLPILHFKFTGSLFAKIEFAMSSGAYHNHSAEYQAYGLLLNRMRDRDDTFLSHVSKRYGSKSDLLRSRILQFEPDA